MLRGNLCPDGAVIKISAADPRLLSHEGTRHRLRGHPRSRRSHRRSRPRGRRRLGARAAKRGTRRRAGHAGVGPPADPCEALEAGRHRPPPHLGRADERHVVRRGRAARRAGVRGRRPARARADGRPDQARRRGAHASTCSSRRPSSPAAAAGMDAAERARTSAATGASTRTTSCRRMRAATSTSCAGAPQSSPTW